MGTGVFIQRPTGEQKIDIPGLLCSIIYQDQQHSEFVVECTVNGAANALVDVESALGISEKEAEQNFAIWAEQYTSPPLFLNGVAGLAAPYWVPNFVSKFVGEGRPEEKVLAVAESILFLVKVNLQLLQENYKPLKKIVVTGGLARNDILCQKLANLIGVSVYRPVDGEATAMGTAYLLSGSTKTWQTSWDGELFQSQQEPGLHERFRQWNIEMQNALQLYAAG
jgi:glycerol kinase